MGNTFCVFHRYAELNLEDGDWLTQETPYQALQEMRRLLQKLGVEYADLFTLKTFRASRATTMAAEGDSLAEIMNAGEWLSSALLSYVNESAVDSQRFVQALMQEDEAEEVVEPMQAPGTPPLEDMPLVAASVVQADDAYAP